MCSSLTRFRSRFGELIKFSVIDSPVSNFRLMAELEIFPVEFNEGWSPKGKFFYAFSMLSELATILQRKQEVFPHSVMFYNIILIYILKECSHKSYFWIQVVNIKYSLKINENQETFKIISIFSWILIIRWSKEL